MKLRINQKTLEAWRTVLLNAKEREIGGVLFGEHVNEDQFRIIEFTQQKRYGDAISFQRHAGEARESLKRLSTNYGNDYTRFNYLGEWHSHPNASAAPSKIDRETMKNLVSDPTTGANFLVLIILRINENCDIELTGTSFLASNHVLECELYIETNEK
ncbi:Mov34/MPN/PAD-1 family protein [Leucothrix mucor]|uniref:Mov34/MPN/PAD-1 family protein n=1 Tax=Leucothrix mucor TaxID=45248 RepID=UPI0003B4F94D|nr:Mov34/MPN/PAD-1 family protein [Leucothrix mucor]